MKFYLLDDLHLEFSGYTLPGDPEGILLLAGDISTPVVYREGRTDQKALKLVPRFNQFFQEECAKYKKAYYIAGNHEYYYGSWQETIPFMHEMCESTNVTVLEKESVDLGDDILLWGATLWTDFDHYNPIAMSDARRGMNDYSVVDYSFEDSSGKMKIVDLSPQITYEDNQVAYEELKEFVKAHPNQKIVVMTHHTPSMKSSHPRWGKTTNPLNYAYCNEYDEWIAEHPQIKVWVHGHTHESHDYYINTTRVICNPRGYSYQKDVVSENPYFSDKLSFEV